MSRPLPLLRSWNSPYWTSGEDGRLRFQVCEACDRLQHPLTPVCRACGSDLLQWRAVSGKAVVQSHTATRQKWSDDDGYAYVVAVVAIDEDPRVRLTTNIVGCPPEQVRVGMRVRVTFEQVDDTWLPLFEPLDEADVDLAAEVQQEVGVRLESGVSFVASSQVETAATDAGLDAATTTALVGDYEDAQIKSLKVGILAVAAIAALSFLVTTHLPASKGTDKASEAST